MNRTFRAFASLCALTLLQACRFGDVWPFGSASSTTPFPVRQAVSAAQETGLAQTLSASGTVTRGAASVKFTGDLTYTVNKAVPATFEGAPALMVAGTIDGRYTVEGQSLEVGGTTFTYLNAGHAMVGESAALRYCVAQAPGVIPAVVTAGQSGTLASYECYTNNRRSTRAGSRTDGWFASAGPGSGALKFRIVSVSSDDAGQTIATGSTTYVVRADGSLRVVGIESTTSLNGITTRLAAK
jgi:hypothetical protein